MPVSFSLVGTEMWPVSLSKNDVEAFVNRIHILRSLIRLVVSEI